MKPINSFNNIYLWREFVDFRKSINGLSALVQEQMNLDPFGTNLFVFSCRRKKRIKILYWDRTGFALWYKRLEEDIFPWLIKSFCPPIYSGVNPRKDFMIKLLKMELLNEVFT